MFNRKTKEVLADKDLKDRFSFRFSSGVTLTVTKYWTESKYCTESKEYLWVVFYHDPEDTRARENSKFLAGVAEIETIGLEKLNIPPSADPSMTLFRYELSGPSKYTSRAWYLEAFRLAFQKTEPRTPGNLFKRILKGLTS